MSRAPVFLLILILIDSQAIFAEEKKSDDSWDRWTWADTLNRGTEEAAETMDRRGFAATERAAVGRWKRALGTSVATESEAGRAAQNLSEAEKKLRAARSGSGKKGGSAAARRRAARTKKQGGKARTRAIRSAEHNVGRNSNLLENARGRVKRAADELDDAAKNLGNIGVETATERWAGRLAGAGKVVGFGVDAKGVYDAYGREGVSGAGKEIAHNAGKDLFSSPIAAAGAEAGFCVAGPPGALVGGVVAGVCSAAVYESELKPVLDREVFDPAIKKGRETWARNPFNVAGNTIGKSREDYEKERWAAWVNAVQFCQGSERALREAGNLAQNALDDAFIASFNAENALDKARAIRGTIDSAVGECNAAPKDQDIFDLGASLEASAQAVEALINGVMSSANAVCGVVDAKAGDNPAPPDIPSARSKLGGAEEQAGEARSAFANVTSASARLRSENGIRNSAIQKAKSVNSAYTDAKASVLMAMQRLGANTMAVQGGVAARIREAQSLHGKCQGQQNIAIPSSLGKIRMTVDLSSIPGISKKLSDAQAKIAEAKSSVSAAMSEIEGMGGDLSGCAAQTPITIDFYLSKADALNISALDAAMANAKTCLDTLVAMATPADDSGDGEKDDDDGKDDGGSKGERDVDDLRSAEGEGDQPNQEGTQIAIGANTTGDAMDNVRSRTSSQTDDAQRDMGAVQDERATSAQSRHGSEMEEINEQGRQAENAVSAAQEQHASAETARQTTREEEDQIGGAAGRGMIEGGSALGASLGSAVGIAAGTRVSEDTGMIVEPDRDRRNNPPTGGGASSGECGRVRALLSDLEARIKENPGDGAVAAALQPYKKEVEKACGQDSSGENKPSGKLEGCTDIEAENYDHTAKTDDGSCAYKKGCTHKDATNYDSWALDDDGSCKYPPPPAQPEPSGGGGGGGAPP